MSQEQQAQQGSWSQVAQAAGDVSGSGDVAVVAGSVPANDASRIEGVLLWAELNPAQQLAVALRGAPTEIREAIEDYTAARCAIHKPVVHGADGAWGCAALAPGQHAAIAALYASSAQANRYCHADEPTLRNDRRLALRALEDSPTEQAFLYQDPRSWVKKLAGTSMGLHEFGAGYCYLHLIRAEYRMRVARLLGPLPLVADVLRLARLVGVRVADKFTIDEFGAFVHVNVEGHGRIMNAGAFYTSRLADVVRRMPNAHIGGAPGILGSPSEGWGGLEYSAPLPLSPADTAAHVETPRLKAFLEHLRGVGVVLPEAARQDMATAILATAGYPICFRQLKPRRKILELAGDVALKMHAVVKTMAGTQTTAEYAALCEQHSNRVCAATLEKYFSTYVEYASAPRDSREAAGMMEAIVGVVVWHCPAPFVRDFIRYLHFHD